MGEMRPPAQIKISWHTAIGWPAAGHVNVSCKQHQYLAAAQAGEPDSQRQFVRMLVATIVSTSSTYHGYDADQALVSIA
jgi:hypothetical protein